MLIFGNDDLCQFFIGMDILLLYKLLGTHQTFRCNNHCVTVSQPEQPEVT